MGRFIPASLRAHLDQPATTTCYLLRIAPRDLPPYGVTNLDRDVMYDDGRGEVRYLAAVGADATALQADANLSVDNAEAESLMPEFDVPVSEADIRAGRLDYAEFDLYLVDYTNPVDHVTLRAGDLGQVSINADGLSTVQELRGLSVRLKQSICQKDSLSCRALFGSQPGPLVNGPLERFPCGVDATALLVAGTVAAVGLENTLTFTVTPFTMEADALNPGMVFWATGLNAGHAYEIDTNTAGGVITLAHETEWPIQVGDTLSYRVDCNKLARDDVKGCAAPIRWGDEWPLHFRGEPDIPIGDMGAMETPGASSAPGSGGSTNVPFETEAE